MGESKLTSDEQLELEEIPPTLFERIRRIESWRHEQNENLNLLLSQVESHYETLNELFLKRKFDLAATINEHFEKRFDIINTSGLIRGLYRLEVADSLELDLERVDLASRLSLLEFDQNYKSVMAHLENIKFIPRTNRDIYLNYMITNKVLSINHLQIQNARSG